MILVMSLTTFLRTADLNCVFTIYFQAIDDMQNPINSLFFKQDSYLIWDMSFNVQTVKPGNGQKPPKGSKVTVHYTGKLTNETVFDSSVKRGTPFVFTLGQGEVIRGWDEGVAQMSVGEKAILTCPPAYAYGNSSVGNGLIPANSTLIFEVELISFKWFTYRSAISHINTHTCITRLRRLYVSCWPPSGPSALFASTHTDQQFMSALLRLIPVFSRSAGSGFWAGRRRSCNWCRRRRGQFWALLGACIFVRNLWGSIAQWPWWSSKSTDISPA